MLCKNRGVDGESPYQKNVRSELLKELNAAWKALSAAKTNVNSSNVEEMMESCENSIKTFMTIDNFDNTKPKSDKSKPNREIPDEVINL